MRACSCLTHVMVWCMQVCAAEALRLIAGEQRRRRFQHHLRMEAASIQCLEMPAFSPEDDGFTHEEEHPQEMQAAAGGAKGGRGGAFSSGVGRG